MFYFQLTIHHLLMDNDEKRDVHRLHTHVHSQDEHDDSQHTKPDMNKDSVRPGFLTYCEVSVDFLSHVSDDYQIVHNVKYEDGQEENIKCHREGDSGGCSEIRCLQSVKIEEERVQHSNDQETINPFTSSA